MAGVATSFPSQATGEPRLVQGDYRFDLNTKERVAWDIPPKIHSLEPIAPGAPILALMNKMGEPVSKKTPIFYMFQRANLRNFIQAAGGDTAGSSTITISSSDVKLFKEGMHLINVRTREIMRVNGTPDTSLPVQRSVGTVAAAALLTNDEIVILGYRGKEQDTRYTGVLRKPTMQFNYIGELQDSYEISQYADAAAMVDGAKSRKEARLDKLEQMRYTLEKASIFDQRWKGIVDNKVVYIPNGLDAICTENEYDFGGSMSEEKLLAASETVARYGPSTRWVMCAPRFMRKINQLFAGERTQDTDTVKFAGVNVKGYQAGNLRLNFFPHLMFQDAPTTGALSMSGTAYVCNFERGGMAPGFGQATMRSDKMGFFKWFLNLETDGNREVIDQLVVNYGFTYTFAEHFARWINPGS